MPDLDAIAARHGVGLDAVRHLLDALARGHGRMAQFNHPDLGGMGQWSAGGMTMIGDMFNAGLKARVVALCDELAPLATAMPGESRGSSQTQSQGFGAGDSWGGSSSGGSSWGGSSWSGQFLGRRLLVAGRPRPAGDLRIAERHALRLLPGFPPPRDRDRRPGDALRHRRPPDRRRLAAAGVVPLPELHQPVRPGAAGGAAGGGVARAERGRAGREPRPPGHVLCRARAGGLFRRRPPPSPPMRRPPRPGTCSG